jgi:hypothetical protein
MRLRAFQAVCALCSGALLPNFGRCALSSAFEKNTCAILCATVGLRGHDHDDGHHTHVGGAWRRVGWWDRGMVCNAVPVACVEDPCAACGRRHSDRSRRASRFAWSRIAEQRAARPWGTDHEPSAGADRAGPTASATSASTNRGRALRRSVSTITNGDSTNGISICNGTGAASQGKGLATAEFFNWTQSG